MLPFFFIVLKCSETLYSLLIDATNESQGCGWMMYLSVCNKSCSRAPALPTSTALSLASSAEISYKINGVVLCGILLKVKYLPLPVCEVGVGIIWFVC